MSPSPKSTLDTPALLVDLDVMESNIVHIAQLCRAHGVQWRPHFKGHKTLEIAQMQISAGAIGVTCAKLGEAEILAANGILDILIANQIVGVPKVRRLIRLLESADVIVSVDSRENVRELADAAHQAGKQLGVVIEVDLGFCRAGVGPGAPVLALADEIAAHSSLRLAGVMGWEAQTTAIADAVEKEKAVAAAISLLTQSADLCRKAGHDIRIVSCGGTGTLLYCIKQPGVTEVQVGGGVMNDAHYRWDYNIDLPFALTVLATVTSRPTPTRVILDAGRKSMSVDTALPRVLDVPAVRELRLTAEHAKLELESPSDWPRVGDRVEFIPGYTDTTVHLHEEMVVLRNGRIEAVWKVAGRGKIK
ncbi:MAG TPA: DSD1 family PLP-dependent enzyme [Rhizomicrobium sp.]|jgi:D-serine deaminase-like pyridoxal phosphate-dependent protein|nr:DSD1 family PLP-dependent enzyme [Rhizomicrobium sp.]